MLRQQRMRPGEWRWPFLIFVKGETFGSATVSTKLPLEFVFVWDRGSTFWISWLYLDVFSITTVNIKSEIFCSGNWSLFAIAPAYRWMIFVFCKNSWRSKVSKSGEPEHLRGQKIQKNKKASQHWISCCLTALIGVQ